MNLYQLIARENPNFAPRRIFDIGANTGQTIREIRAVWPSVMIDAFEPISSTFQRLRANTGTDSNLDLYQIAFGSRPGRATMLAIPGSPMNRILRQPRSEKQIEEVELASGDIFCEQHHIDRIDILKIDAEGHDLEGFGRFHSNDCGAARGICCRGGWHRTWRSIPCALHAHIGIHVCLWLRSL